MALLGEAESWLPKGGSCRAGGGSEVKAGRGRKRAAPKVKAAVEVDLAARLGRRGPGQG